MQKQKNPLAQQWEVEMAHRTEQKLPRGWKIDCRHANTPVAADRWRSGAIKPWLIWLTPSYLNISSSQKSHVIEILFYKILGFIFLSMMYWAGQNSAFPFNEKLLYFNSQASVQTHSKISVLRICFDLQLQMWKYCHFGIFWIEILQELQDKDSSNFHLCTPQYKGSGWTKMQTVAKTGHIFLEWFLENTPFPSTLKTNK